VDRAFLRRLAGHAGLSFVAFEPSDDGDLPLAGVIAYADVGGVVSVAVSDARDLEARRAVVEELGPDVNFALVSPDDLARATDRAYAPEALVDLDVEHPSRLGERLVVLGMAEPGDIVAALDEQERTGSRVGEILLHRQRIDEDDLVEALSLQFGLPIVGLTDVVPEPAALAEIPEPVARLRRCVPLAIRGGVLELAVTDGLDANELADLREHTELELAPMLATKASVDELLVRVYGRGYVEAATTELLNRFPDESAAQVVTRAQRIVLIVASVLALAALVAFPIPTLVVLFALASVFYLAVSCYRMWLTYRALGHEYELHITDEELAALDERTLPVYTILVPLYQEAAVVPRLAAGIDGLDYPKTKLDVRLLCETDDLETIDAIRALRLPAHFRLVIVPESQPKTKPKACNYGLLQAEGRYVVIYDAEDRPDPDQLKRVAIAFAKADSAVTCVQAKLNYFNQRQNLLTRWFSVEYSLWFDLMLPGLDKEGVPIPLGGTSNHFLLDRLVELGAWDPFNVTEDADLGVRLHKAGYKTAIIDSTTLEEANSRVDNWIRQRSRWIKGYIQTWLVHMRHPVRLLRAMGLKSWLSFQMTIGGTFIFLLNPIFWLLTTVFFLTRAGIIEQLFPSVVYYAAATLLFVGNFVFVYLNVAGVLQRRAWHLATYALLSPLYWGLMSIAAWKGFVQLFTKPFYWEKTVHGLDR
jgi:cellulose synthase/poly-beta-1,6-N-acetylglucosamine synthase-like glycosyltransferase